MSSKFSWQHDSYYDESPPHTPARFVKYTGSQSGRVTTKSSVPQTFLEDITPVDADQHEDSGDEEKDPHDLALSPRHITRTSVVDNMLLSLDQFSEANFNVVEQPHRYHSQDSDSYTLYSRYATSRLPRHRGHTFSSSLSSEVEAFEDNGGRYPNLSARGRRSNSSSNFQPMMRRADGVNSGTEKPSSRTRVFESQRANMNNQSCQYTGNGTRGSDSSGIDITQMLTGNRFGRGRRSVSFDYGADGPSKLPVDHGVLHYDDINAAPTPNVPAGPRNHSPALKDCTIPPQGATVNPRAPALSRKNSTKSARSIHNKKGRSDTLGTSTIKGRPDDNRYLRDPLPDIPPVPTHMRIPAPSPTIALHKPAQFSQHTEAITPPTPKERYGFFRRVFGSSKTSSPTQPERTQRSTQDNDIFSRPRGSQSAPNSSKGYPSQGQHNVGRDNNPIVSKKPSSFFRRRKKSMTDNVPPPLVLPRSDLKLGHAKGDIEVQPSPNSSLRQAMKPYITGCSSPALESWRPLKENSMRGGDVEAESGNQCSPRKVDDTIEPRKWTCTDDRQPSSQNNNDNTMTKVISGIDPSFAHDDRDSYRDGYALTNSNGSDGTLQHSTEDPSRRPKTSPTPQTSFRTSMLPTEGKQVSKVAARVDKKLSINTTLRPRDRASREPASSTGPKDESCKAVSLSEGPSQSPPVSASTTVSQYQTAFNTPLLSPAEDPNSKLVRKVTSTTSPIKESLDENSALESGAVAGATGSPSAADRQRAQELYNDVAEETTKDELTATWLGNPDRAGVRKAYMDLFDWSDMNILVAMRSLCSKMTLKGETQQVDRVLDAFSSRWCECNPNHGFKATDVVHTICYSLLLLNTDLHLADIEQKMTRNQFIRNTMPTIQRVVVDAAPNAFESTNSSNKSYRPRNTEENGSQPGRDSTPYLEKDEADGSTTSYLLSKPQDQTPRANSVISTLTANCNDVSTGASGQLVSMPFRGTKVAWENQVESVLKEFYNSIQKRRLPLRGAQVDSEEQQPSNNFLTLTGNMLRRTPSAVSKVAASDSFPRGRSAENRLSTARWASKTRSRARMYPSSTMTSSRTSLDDQSSVWSPAASSTWSKVSLGKTLTSMSVDSLGSEYPRGDYQQSIGFANALSHAIIREDSASCITGTEGSARAESLLEDEALELAGAPWAKEGSLKHKHHLDSVDKRAKDRNWNETFAVIQRGWMRLFSFNSSTKSMRLKLKEKQSRGLVVGGGNWMENAEETWKFLLRHSIASALPQPGYSKSRPYVWALSLPTGAVHLFQVGTPEIVKEFVSTANYWSARLSKEPMFGGISNIEYGWSDAVINIASTEADDHKPTNPPGARLSIQSSIRSSIDQQAVRPRLPADRIHISDWMPPQQSMIASTLTEEQQLVALRNYVKYVEEELKRHNELRSAMALAFTPRHPNATKALANWERKSSYLLREIVKFRTYIDCLQSVEVQKEKFYNSLRPEKQDTKDGEQV
ncbi:hypothetical protein PRK78_005890 [Emydomyces testavorans]|uniref:SEC7 domain-containing protein n=1 Tax=Emydomyces testavorans TaxID=2070801 RepID=A0AAF0DKG2_9EURO|nr:hypothetical protein PRK78_005890 [Emydomyces testavorans]